MKIRVDSAEAYLKALEPQKRAVVAAVRGIILEHLPEGYVERIEHGMLAYAVPLELYPHTDNKQPLCYLSLAAQARHFALYLCTLYMDKGRAADFQSAFAKADKKLDMGKSCVRFKKLDDLHLPTLGELVASTSVDEFIDLYEHNRANRGPC